MFDLSGKSALVTGASGGIGGAIARHLHQAGANVGLSGTRVDALETLAGDLGERCAVLPCDLGDGDAVSALIGQADEALGAVETAETCNHEKCSTLGFLRPALSGQGWAPAQGSVWF